MSIPFVPWDGMGWANHSYIGNTVYGNIIKADVKNPMNQSVTMELTISKGIPSAHPTTSETPEPRPETVKRFTDLDLLSEATFLWGVQGLDVLGWLVGLVGLVGWLVGWLVGLLVGSILAQLSWNLRINNKLLTTLLSLIQVKGRFEPLLIEHHNHLPTQTWN